MALAVGALLQNSRYQIHSVLESTDVDVTYEALHTYLDRTVVLKQLRSDVSWSLPVVPSSRALMAQLTQLTQCQHPCLGKILDCFEDDGQLYLILPTYSEPTLEQWLPFSETVQPSTVLGCLRPLVDCLEQLHQTGLVHGNLTLQTLRYRLRANELIIADIGWRMLLSGLLSDRHQVSDDSSMDICSLAKITDRLLGEKTPSTQAFLTNTLKSTTLQSLSPKTWLNQLESTITFSQLVFGETMSLQVQAAAPKEMQRDQIGDDRRDNHRLGKGTLTHQRQQWLPALLGMTAILAAVSGGTVGYLFRTQDAAQLDQSPLFGNEIFGSDQDFPPSEYWPGLKDRTYGPSVLFERIPTQQAATSPTLNEVGGRHWEQADRVSSPQLASPPARVVNRRSPGITEDAFNKVPRVEDEFGHSPHIDEETVVNVAQQEDGDLPSPKTSLDRGTPVSDFNSDDRLSDELNNALSDKPNTEARNRPNNEAVAEWPPEYQTSPSDSPYVTEMPPPLEQPSTTRPERPPLSDPPISAPDPTPAPAPLITPIMPPPANVDNSSTLESTDVSAINSPLIDILLGLKARGFPS